MDCFSLRCIIMNPLSLHFGLLLEVEYVETCILHSHKFKSSRVYLYSLKLSQKANRFKKKQTAESNRG